MGPPIYGLASAQRWRRVKGGCGWGGDEYSLGLSHTASDIEIEVTTDTGRSPPGFEEQMMLHQWFGRRVAALSEPTYPLVLAVNRWTQTIKVNGEPVTFTVIGDDSTWLACARIANRLVTVEAQGCRPDHVELESVDPKNYADV